MNRHLSDLRTRVIKCALAYCAIFAICFYFSNDLYGALAKLIPAQLVATKVTSTFMVPLQLCLFCALLIVAPYFLWNLWTFISPGLYLRERHNIGPWLIFSCILFYSGITFALLVMAPMALKFFAKCAPPNVTVMIEIGNYLDFITTLATASAIAFQVPIITLFLLRTGIISHQQLSDYRPYIIIMAFVVGMLLTPPDVISTILLGLPIWGLFELGIIIDKFKNDKSVDFFRKNN